MGIFRFIRTCQINGNLGGARVTASKISFVFLWINFAQMNLSGANRNMHNGGRPISVFWPKGPFFSSSLPSILH